MIGILCKKAGENGPKEDHHAIQVLRSHAPKAGEVQHIIRTLHEPLTYFFLNGVFSRPSNAGPFHGLPIPGKTHNEGVRQMPRPFLGFGFAAQSFGWEALCRLSPNHGLSFPGLSNAGPFRGLPIPGKTHNEGIRQTPRPFKGGWGERQLLPFLIL